MATRIGVYGKIDTYKFDSIWGEFIERLDHFFTANEITDKDKILSAFAARKDVDLFVI